MKKSKEEKEVYKATAMYLAFSNAAEFIRGHQESGFTFVDEELNNEYKKAIKKASCEIEKMCIKYLKTIHESTFEIDIDTEDEGFL